MSLYLKEVRKLSKRCILIKPQFHNVENIETLRRKYDPMAKYGGPHITLVFPFESDITEDALRKHVIKAVSGFTSFELKLQGITGTSFLLSDRTDNCLFLNVKQGNDKLIELHDKLYTGILEEYLCREVSYSPHVTLGKIENLDAYQNALEETKKNSEVFRTRVNSLNVEIVESNGILKHEFSVSLY
jgi:2'-5' RNA ligase